VCCTFNNSYKYSEPLFELWLRVLQRVPGSVLWLIAEDAATESNLRREAARRGLAAERLVLSRRVPYEDYLARLACADLFLDTLPFNAGTTASDALWAGVPLLTCAGEAFAARMAGSLVRAAGLPELVTFSLEEYEQEAVELLSAPARLAELRRRLALARQDCALFNTERHCRALEAAFWRMWQRLQRGEAPASIRVAPHELEAEAL
jgi:predicted O-linked N-acetylglucosamine transferase (SPINDLY family)